MAVPARKLVLWLMPIGIGAASGVAPGNEPAPSLARFEWAETHMGTRFQIVLYSADEPAARRACRAAFARIAALDAALSDYQPESELMRLCRQAGGPPVAVSADLFEVLCRSRGLSERSGGAFDVTVAPVVRLWRRARREHKLPDPERLAAARALVGFERMRLDPRARTVQLVQRGMKLDLGGIAKGFAAQEALGVLKHAGWSRALVAGSGDIVVGDPPPGRAGWSIGIAPLEPPEARPHRFLSLAHAAVSTSGDAEQYVEIGGRRYSHIVDPATGLGVVDRCGVTVVAGDGATADGLATAVYVLGPARGLALVEATPGAAARIVRATPAGEQTIVSERFPLLDHDRSPAPPAGSAPGERPEATVTPARPR
jgi:thiamine biosynthesis lipoprotein